MASSYVGGLSGAFIPVSEDKGMIDAVTAGALTIEKLEAMTCVCSVGLDMIAVPGDTSAASIAGVIADEMAIGMVNQKTTAVRLIPVIGKKVGDNVELAAFWLRSGQCRSTASTARTLWTEEEESPLRSTASRTKE